MGFIPLRRLLDVYPRWNNCNRYWSNFGNLASPQEKAVGQSPQKVSIGRNEAAVALKVTKYSFFCWQTRWCRLILLLCDKKDPEGLRDGVFERSSSRKCWVIIVCWENSVNRERRRCEFYLSVEHHIMKLLCVQVWKCPHPERRQWYPRVKKLSCAGPWECSSNCLRERLTLL